MAVKEVEGEREGKHTEMQTHIFTHSLAPAHTHAHTHTLLYQQNESAFWQYLNETEKSPIQPLCLAFINTARHWGDISLPSLAPSLLQTDTLTHTDMRTHTHINRGRSPVQVWWCLLLAFPPQSLFFLLAPPHLWAFVTSPPPPTTVLFHHTSLPPLSLSLSLLSLRLFASAAEWKYAQMRKGAVKLHISTGGSGSITDPISLRTRGREQGTTILLDNSSGPSKRSPSATPEPTCLKPDTVCSNHSSEDATAAAAAREDTGNAGTESEEEPAGSRLGCTDARFFIFFYPPTFPFLLLLLLPQAAVARLWRSRNSSSLSGGCMRKRLRCGVYLR